MKKMISSAGEEGAAGKGDGPERAGVVASLVDNGIEYFDRDDMVIGRHRLDSGKKYSVDWTESTGGCKAGGRRINLKVEPEYAALCTRGLCDRQGTKAVTLLDVTLNFVHGPATQDTWSRGCYKRTNPCWHTACMMSVHSHIRLRMIAIEGLGRGKREITTD